jgi:hypothetical protein
MTSSLQGRFRGSLRDVDVLGRALSAEEVKVLVRRGAK